MICIDRAESQCAKQKGKLIKHDGKGVRTDRKMDIAYLLKHRPNELMTPYHLIHTIKSLKSFKK